MVPHAVTFRPLRWPSFASKCILHRALAGRMSAGGTREMYDTWRADQRRQNVSTVVATGKTRRTPGPFPPPYPLSVVTTPVPSTATMLCACAPHSTATAGTALRSASVHCLLALE